MTPSSSPAAVTPPSVIYFDAAGTLIGLVRPVGLHYSEVAARHGYEISPMAIGEAFSMTWREMPSPPTTRVPRADDDRSWWQEFVDRVLDKCAVPRAVGFDRRAYFDELYDEFTKPGVWAVFPDAAAILPQLAQRYTLGIMSNFDRRLRPILEELRIAHFFRHIIISSEVGADKPDPWIFYQASTRAGVPAHEILHVGDEPAADWEGAAAAGFQVFRLRRPELTLEHLRQLLLWRHEAEWT